MLIEVKRCSMSLLCSTVKGEWIRIRSRNKKMILKHTCSIVYCVSNIYTQRCICKHLFLIFFPFAVLEESPQLGTYYPATDLFCNSRLTCQGDSPLLTLRQWKWIVSLSSGSCARPDIDFCTGRKLTLLRRTSFLFHSSWHLFLAEDGGGGAVKEKEGLVRVEVPPLCNFEERWDGSLVAKGKAGALQKTNKQKKKDDLNKLELE